MASSMMQAGVCAASERRYSERAREVSCVGWLVLCRIAVSGVASAQLSVCWLWGAVRMSNPGLSTVSGIRRTT